MVKAAQHRESDDLFAWASICGRNRSGGHSLADPLMRTSAVEMGDMLLEHAKHVALAEDEDVIQALAARTAEIALTHGVGLRCSNGRTQHSDASGLRDMR